jgi:hypothetical protein
MHTVQSHTKRVLRTTAASILLLILGCSLPVIPADNTYEVLGGIVQRDHPALGRQITPVMSSIFTEPGSVEPLKHSPIIP